MFIKNHKETATMPTPKHSQLKASTPMKVLLVEDSILIRNTLIEILNNDGNLTVNGIAATQNSAIALLDEQQFDMLLVDIELADGNGFEVIRHTQKANYPFKPPVLVMLTNHANSQYRKLAKELGVNYFFDKSMDFDLAIETIEFEAEKFANTVH
jgi:DNA-binding NarL/FixJ family response regulator